ncbi:flagellar hook-length control protein FliK [Alteromonas sp. D210916BOD_24]|uniref:flagellar hook-length control protein FliK n=1 Tax=Alteromonas sp. D210916BOD_24 TaxID=3157618 RepID=UPI00399CD05D
MQQVAAQKTDLAALPFATSNMAKAVETGIDSRSESHNNRIFNDLYREARSDKQDFVPRQRQKSEVATTGYSSAADSQHRHSNHDRDPLTQREDRSSTTSQYNEPHHTKSSVVNAQADTIEQHADIKEGGIDAVAQESELESDESASPRLGIDGNVEQGDSEEQYLIVGEGGKKDAEAGVTSQLDIIDVIDTSVDASEPDWVAFVESIARQNNETVSGDMSDAVSDSEDEGLDIEQAAKNALSNSLWKLPDNVNDSSVSSVLSHLIEQLNSTEPAKVNGELSDINEETVNIIRALGDLLRNLTSAEQNELGNEPVTLDQLSARLKSESTSEDALSSILAQLSQAKGTEGVEGNASTTSSPSHLSAEDAFILSVISNEINGNGPVEAEALEADLAATQAAAIAVQSSDNAKQGVVASQSNSELVKGSEGSPLANADTVELDPLLAAISELPQESAQKATEAIADRIVATLPNNAQQQAVKTNIIAGINEFQQQVQQGREPGIDLSAIVAEAAKEAAVSADMASNLSMRADAQASQFLQLMNTTQHSVHQVMQGQLTQVDAVVNENNQLRAEASKTQQQFEGFDKAVNIHKPEGHQQLNEKIRWMVNARNTMAEIRLDPPELGSMQVRVNVAGDAASVSFVVQSQQAKDALSDAMPKLREMLSEQGIELGDAQVRKDNSSNGQNGQQLADNTGNSDGKSGNRGNSDGLTDDVNDSHVIEQGITRRDKGGIDFYA